MAFSNKVYPVAIGDPAENVLDMRRTHDAGTVLLDGFTGLPGGMNAGTDPSLIESAAQYAFGVNLTSRGGLLKTRPPFIRLEAYIPPGKFQGAARYRRTDGDRIVYCVDGVVYSLNLETFRRYRIGAFPSTTFDIAYFCQADRFMVIQNGIIYPENWPILLDGDFIVDNANVQYFDDTNGWQYLGDHAHYDAVRVPIGTSMAYGHGRLFVAVPRIWDTGKLSGSEQWLPSTGTRSFCASDIFQSDNPSEFLAFIESTYLSGGGAISLPATLGYITGMTLFRASASGTGLGALVVFGSEGVCAYGVNSPRSQWQDIDLANVLFLGSGTESPRSVVTINDDVVFRAADGWRFLKYTATQVTGSGGNLSNLPQSFEMTPVVGLDSRLERSFASAAYVNNRLLMTSAGYVSGSEILFDALISLDAANVGSVASVNTTPIYDGVWTGHAFMQVLDARYDYIDRAFAFVKVAGTRNELWYVDDTSDATHLDGNVTAIESKLVTRTHTFQAPRNTKEFKYVEEWLSKTRGTVILGAYWRSDGYELWNSCVPYTFISDVSSVTDSLPQSRWKLRLPPTSVNVYDPVTGRDVRMGTSFQFCFTWTGTMKLDKLLLQGVVCTEATADTGCTTAEGVPLLEGTGGTSIDMYDYTIPPLTALTADTYWTALTIGREPLFYWVFDRVVDGVVYGDLVIVGPVTGGVLGGDGSPWEFAWPEYPEGPEIVADYNYNGGGGGTAPSAPSIPYVPTIPVPPLGPGDQVKIPTKQPESAPNYTYIIWYTPPDGAKTATTPSGQDVNNKYDPSSPSNKYLSLVMPECITIEPGSTSDWKVITVKNYGPKLREATFGLPGTGSTSSKVHLELQAMTGGVNVDVPVGTGTGYKFSLGAGEEMSFRVRASVDDTWSLSDGPSSTRLDYNALLNDVIWDDGTVGFGDNTQAACVIVNAFVPVPNCGGAVTFTAMAGDTYPLTQASTISNDGVPESSLVWTAESTGDPAMSMSPLSGTIAGGASEAVTVTMDPAGLDEGTHTTEFIVTAPGGLSCTKTATVTVGPDYTGDVTFTAHLVDEIIVDSGPGSPSTTTSDESLTTSLGANWTVDMPTGVNHNYTASPLGKKMYICRDDSTGAWSVSMYSGFDGYDGTGSIADSSGVAVDNSLNFDATTGKPTMNSRTYWYITNPTFYGAGYLHHVYTLTVTMS